MIKNITCVLFFITSLVLGSLACAAPVIMKGVRVWSKQESTRVVFELSAKPKIESLEL